MYTEFYCDPVNGDDHNGGAPIGGVYPIAYTNGAWNAGTGVFTPVSANPQTDGVTVGDFAAVFTDGNVTPSFVGRVLARDATTITIDVAAVFMGVAPGTAASGITCRVGGPWKSLPFVAAATLSSLAVSNVFPRLNLRNNATHNVSGSTLNTNGWTRCTAQGYSTTPGDGGKAIIDEQGSVRIVWSNGSSNAVFKDLVIVNSASSGTDDGFTNAGVGCHFENVVVHGMRGRGFNNTGANVTHAGCEAYDNNRSNTANFGGFATSATAGYLRSIAHDNGGSNGHGFVSTASSNLWMLMDCIAESNGGAGIFMSSGAHIVARGCDLYNNGGAGLDMSTAGTAPGLIENCNFLKNGTYGIKGGTFQNSLLVQNCGFGRGTQANASGDVSSPVGVLSSVIYAADVTPWVDPANGDFRISLAAAKGTGLGTFTETAASYAGTIAFPDIGAAQHREVSGAAAARTRITTPGVLCG
jgi:hypothetical protein